MCLLGGCTLNEAPKGEGDGPTLVIGRRGSGPGCFSSPRGLAVASDGRVAVTDKTGRVIILTPDGEELLSWKLPKIDNGTPTGIVFDETDPTTPTLLIADTHNSRVLRYSLGGHLVDQFGEYGDQPGRMIYPTDVAVDAEGTIYLTEYGLTDRVMKFDREGRFIDQWGGFGREDGRFQRPLGLVWTPEGRIIVADTCNHRIQTFTTEGEHLATWGGVGSEAGEFNYPYDLTLGPGGDLFVIEYGNNRIQCLDARGNPKAIYGRPGSAPGDFAAPWGVALGAGRLVYVADTNNHRVQVFPARWLADGVRVNES